MTLRLELKVLLGSSIPRARIPSVATLTKEERVMNPKQSLAGKTVFVGIDVHKTTYSVCVVCESEIVGKASMPADAQALLQYLKRFAGSKVCSAYEAGYFGFKLHRTLEANGIENIVINPSAIEVAANDRVKTDKRDARKLAELLSLHRLKGIRIPTIEEEEHRMLTRTREQLMQQRSKIATQILAKIRYLGIEIPDLPQHVNKHFVARLLAAQLPPEVHSALNAMTNIWSALREEIKTIDKRLLEQAKSDGEKEKTYRSAPGIGPLAARTLSNELGDMSQFKNERALFCFTGLTPSEHSSGEKTRRGHITRQGASRLRGVLVEAAWNAIRADAVLNSIYRNIAARRGKQRAIVATARHLVGNIRACFRKHELWKSELKAIPA